MVSPIWKGIPSLHLSKKWKKKSSGQIQVLPRVIGKRYASIQIYIFTQIIQGDIPCEKTLDQYIYINKPRGRSGGVPPTPPSGWYITLVLYLLNPRLNSNPYGQSQVSPGYRKKVGRVLVDRYVGLNTYQPAGGFDRPLREGLQTTGWSLLHPGDAVGIVLSGATLQARRNNNSHSEQYQQSKPSG